MSVSWVTRDDGDTRYLWAVPRMQHREDVTPRGRWGLPAPQHPAGQCPLSVPGCLFTPFLQPPLLQATKSFRVAGSRPASASPLLFSHSPKPGIKRENGDPRKELSPRQGTPTVAQGVTPTSSQSLRPSSRLFRPLTRAPNGLSLLDN